MSTHTPILSIIIVSYNTEDLTLACLNSIIRATKSYPILLEQIEVIVVDNASGDNTVNLAKKTLSEAGIKYQVLGNIINTGFSAANNQGIMLAKGKYLFLLNSDTLVGKKTLSVLIETAQSLEKPALLSASLLNTDQSYQPQGGDLPNLFSLLGFALMLDDLPFVGRFVPSIQHTGKRSTKLKRDLTKKGWVAGTALLIPSQVIIQAGTLDEQIFMYAEDLEYCWRARKKGYNSYIVKNAQVIHLGSASSSKLSARKAEFSSLLYVCRTHFSPFMAGTAVFLLKLAAHSRQFIYKILGNTQFSDLYKEIAQSIR